MQEKKKGQLSACFVLPSFSHELDFFSILRLVTKIHKSGAGTGFYFSSEFDQFNHAVNPNSNLSIKYINYLTELLKVSGRRSGAIMAVMNFLNLLLSSFQNFKLDDQVKKMFLIAHEISSDWHLLHQQAFQDFTDNVVFKTINLPSEATVDEVERIYIKAWSMGLKGIRVYRNQSEGNQVLNAGLCMSKAKEC